MAEARPGNTVHIHYTGTLRDGSVFDSSRGRAPLAFTLGSGQVIPGFDAAVTGMRVGDEQTVTIPADAAYGPHRRELVLDLPRDQFPPHIEPEVGQQLQLTAGEEQRMIVTVRAVGDERVVLDGNHPLAGEDLTFALQLVAIG
jgi:peptidylprolyl isomerase